MAGELAQWETSGDRGLSNAGLTVGYTFSDQASVPTPTKPRSPHLSSSPADADHLTCFHSVTQAGLDHHLLCAGNADVLNHTWLQINF